MGPLSPRGGPRAIDTKNNDRHQTIHFSDFVRIDPAMESRSSRLVASHLPRRIVCRAAGLTAWLCGSLAVMAAAETPASLFGEASWGPVQLAAQSWCEVRLPAESSHDGQLAFQSPPQARPDLAAASQRGATTSLMPDALMASGDVPVAAARGSVGPLCLDREPSVMGREPADSFSELKSAIRGPGADAELAPRGELRTTGHVPGPEASGSRTEPAIWAIVAIAVCGLGLAGLSAPWMTTRLATPKPRWRA